MIDALYSAVEQFSQPSVVALMMGGIALGLIFGVFPGIGGMAALAILIPFVYGMEPVQGLAFLLALQAVTMTGGSVTAIVLGIPGTASSAATVMDGYPLSQQGKAGYAVGAALTASALGGLLGVIVLVVLLPVLQPIARALGSPEIFFLAVLGIAFIGALGADRPLEGLIAGALGIFLACFGYQWVSGTPRFWLGSEYLLNGFRLVPLSLGLFAVPEIIWLLSTGRAIASASDESEISWRQLGHGIVSVFRNWRLFLRSSVIGVVVGIVPGVGGATAPFVAYASAKQMAKNRDEFGKGAIEGVIAPESSNNGTQGGALVPTLAFGIPGSEPLALILGAFLILGLDPGPGFLRDHMDIAFGLALVLAAANLVGAGVMLALAARISLVTRVPGHILGSLLLVMVVLGAYSSANNPIDVLFVFVFGALGYFMKELGFSRPALLLGFVLGPIAETYFHISLNAYGPWFFMRPISLVMFAFMLAGIIVPLLRESRREKAHG